MRLALRVLLSLIILSTVLIFSGCTTPQLIQPHPEKPVTCLLPVPPHLSRLTDEYKRNAQERNSLLFDLETNNTLNDSQQRTEVARILGIDKRQAQILIDLKIDDGEAYATATSELGDCQNWIKRQP